MPLAFSTPFLIHSSSNMQVHKHVTYSTISAFSATSFGLWVSAMSLETFLANPSARLSAVLTKTTSTTPCLRCSISITKAPSSTNPLSLTCCYLMNTTLSFIESLRRNSVCSMPIKSSLSAPRLASTLRKWHSILHAVKARQLK